MRTGGELAPGDTLGSYRLEEFLGEGAVGVVFRAIRGTDGEVVALKILRAELSDDETFLRRFAHEARSAQEVKNRHLVPILEAGEADGRPFLAVRYVPGRSLQARIEAEGPLPVKDILRLAAGIASAVDALHREGLVHRDIKPSNILLDEGGSARLTDFGVAKGPAYTVLTRTGQVIGTLDYLAPELIRGQPATPASDLYALGCVLFECVAGQPPFAGKSLFQLSAAHLEQEPSDPSAGREDVPPGFGWAVTRALAKDPADRPPNATAYVLMLRAAAGA